MSNTTYRQWQCTVCGEIYDEALGLPECGIAPGTRFEDVSDEWLCVACGSPKSDYVIIDA